MTNVGAWLSGDSGHRGDGAGLGVDAKAGNSVGGVGSGFGFGGCAGRGARPVRARRSVLAVPGSSDRFIEKSRSLPVDALFLDLEDAVAPGAKQEARRRIVDALQSPLGWVAETVTVRVNDWTTPWTVADLVAVCEAADKIDAIVLPKVTSADQVRALDMVVTQLEHNCGVRPGKIGFELQIEEGLGLLHVEEIAKASARTETLVFGPGDYMAAMGMRQVTVGSQPDGYLADAFHHALMTILTAARAYGLQAIDGPFVAIDDPDGFTVAAKRSAALGYAGKWVIHPSQIETVHQVFSPSADAIERARQIVCAYRQATETNHVGAIRVNGEMVDEAGMKVALTVLAQAGIADARLER